MRSRTQKGHRFHRQRQSGIALLTVLFALLLISGIAFGMMYMANTETVINTNFRDLQKAQYGAWSGIHEARARLITTSPNPITKPTDFPKDNTPANLIYILNAAAGETVDPSTGTYADTEICHEGHANLTLSGTPSTGVACSGYPATTAFTTTTSYAPGQGQAYALPYKWVRINMKANGSAGGDYTSGTSFKVKPSSSSQTTPVCWDGYRQQLLPSGASCEAYVPTDPSSPYLTTVYMLTSLGVTPSGARRMAQMEVAFNPPFASNAAVASNDNVVLNGALVVNGYDNCSCICYCKHTQGGTTTFPRVQDDGTCPNNGDTIDHCSNRSGNTCNSKWGIYAEGSVQNPTGANENVYSSSSPAYSGGNTNFPYNPTALVEAYSSMAGVVNVTTSGSYGWTCTSSGCGTHSGPTFGTYPSIVPSDPTFDAYVNNPTSCTTVGGISVGPCTVFQITYIPGGSGGATHLTGGATGAGVLLVQGDLYVDGGLTFYGLIIVTGSVKFSGGGSNPTNIFGAIISGQPVVDTTTVGGSANIWYDQCALANQFKGQPPSILASRELPY